MKPNPKRKKNMYFDSVKWDVILIKIQDYYEVERQDKQFENLKNELGIMLSNMANKIIKHKKLCSPGDIFDVVNECICNCFHLLSKGKFNPSKGKSFSWLTRVIQNTAIWYHYRNNADIPFATFQEKSVIEESDENLILYLAEYYQNCCYYPQEHIDSKTGQVKTSSNIMKKKELRLQPFYQLVTQDFENNFISRLESRIINKRLKMMKTVFSSEIDYDKYDRMVVESLIKYLETEKKIENITVRRVKKFAVNYLIKEMKKYRWRIGGREIEEIQRSEIISLVNKIFETKVKPFLRGKPEIDNIVKEETFGK